MNRLLAFIVLLSHINFTMFIPQVDEVDVYDVHGRQLDDINSLYEYVDEVVFHDPDLTPEDEDDDRPRDIHIVKVIEYSVYQNVITVERLELSLGRKNTPSCYLVEKIPSVFAEVQSPPPKA